MAIAQRKRRIYWLTESVSALQREKGLLLNQKGFEVHFFRDFASFQSEVRRQRVGIIIVSDDGEDSKLEQNFTKLITMPDIQGARLILSVAGNSQPVSRAAACSSFRDIIPIDLDDKQWLTRFAFATARKSIPYPRPYPQVSLNSHASVSVPARLIWVGANKLLLEAKLRPTSNATINLSGPFAGALGLKTITCMTEQHRHTGLVFRFSDAVLCRWSIPATSEEVAEGLLQKMRQNDFGPRCKVFLALQEPALREQFTKLLDPLRFDVNIALQKQSLIDEPRFFSPEIVFIEDRLCIGHNQPTFKLMLEALSPDIPVYIVGNRVKISDVQVYEPTRRFSLISKIPDKLTEYIFSKYLPPGRRVLIDSDEGAIHISPDHPFSIAEANFSARLTRIHPSSVQIAAPVRLGNFGLCKIDSPFFTKFIGFSPYAKIHSYFDNPQPESQSYKYFYDCYLCNVNSSDRKKIGVSIARFLSEKLLGYNAIKSEVVAVATVASEVRAKQVESVNDLATLGKELEKIVDTVGEGVKESFSEARKIFTSQGFRLTAVFMSVTIFSLTVLWLTLTYLQPHWDKSGGEYSDSLKKFAPGAFEKTH